MKNIICLIFFLIMLACNKESHQDNGNFDVGNPNIIYILADDLGYGDVQSFNENGKIATPNIDAMAANGVMFTDAHTSSAVCTPTRYGILTGRYSWRTTLKSSVLSGSSKSLIKKDRTTIASMLKTQGYKTAFIGKWHLGWDWDIIKEDTTSTRNILEKLPEINFTTPIKNGPSTHGFDYYFGFSGSLDMGPYVWVENDQPTEIPKKITQSVDFKGFWRKGPTSDDFDHALTLKKATDKALDYIGLQSKKVKPFFLYLALPAPHTPILPMTEFLGKSNTNMYGDYVMEVDDVVRQIREAVKKEGISENTLIVFTSDNGCSPRANFDELEQVGHNPSYVFRGAKADIYEGGHTVPFIIEWPKGAHIGKIGTTICTTDFFATCAAITNYKIKDNEGEDSYSMLPLIEGKESKDFREYTVLHSVNGSFAIRKDKWKLICCPGSGGWSYPTLKQIKEKKLDLPPMQLYNLEEDISETNNLIDVFPEKAKELKRALAKIIMDGRSTPGIPQQNDSMDGWKQIENIIN